MSIFGRDETPGSTPSPQPPTPRPTQTQRTEQVTLICAGTRVEGEISGPTEIRIEGEVEGILRVDALVTVGTNGQVRGEIHAKAVAVSGKVIGNILGGDKVDIHASGKLEGDVKAPRVSIADGAYFKGRVEMTGDATPKRSKPVSKSPPQAVGEAVDKPSSKPSLDTVKAGEPLQ